MNWNRRIFLKTLVAIPVGYVLLKTKPEPVASVTVNGETVRGPFSIEPNLTETKMLEGWADLHAIERMPGESDSSLRKRIIAVRLS